LCNQSKVGSETLCHNGGSRGGGHIRRVGAVIDGGDQIRFHRHEDGGRECPLIAVDRDTLPGSVVAGDAEARSDADPLLQEGHIQFVVVSRSVDAIR